MMDIKDPKEKIPVSPNPWGSLEKTAGDNQDLPEVLNADDDNGGMETTADDTDLENLDEYPENPYEETDEIGKSDSTEEFLEKKDLQEKYGAELTDEQIDSKK